ncbi:hypothetical protein PV772_18130 [Pseudarthrobacter sp. CC12]|uniref:hypothetical protein n=1 Tax=Pseudarthrobacter sp. CC12 TaxID=3029193 RepID=UPI003266B85E
MAATPQEPGKPVIPRALAFALRQLRRAPATLGWIFIFWAAGAVSSSLIDGPSGTLRPNVAAAAHSVPGHWWALPASGFWAHNLTGYLLGSALTLMVGLALEPRMGSARFAAAALGSQILGIAAALGFLAAAHQVMGAWTREMSGHLFLGPSALITGALMAGTATMPTLWRRRIRLAVFALLILLALYTGGFADLVRLGAAVAGALLGPVLHPGSAVPSPPGTKAGSWSPCWWPCPPSDLSSPAWPRTPPGPSRCCGSCLRTSSP